MRVAVDAAPARSRPTGVGVYVRDLARALVVAAPNEVAFVGVRPDGPLVDVGGISSPIGGRHHQLWLQRQADRDVRAVGASLAHFTNAYAPLRSHVPYVLTVQDLSTILHPLWHPPARLALAPLMLASMLRAAAIIVPSTATRREIERLIPRPVRRRLVVVGHAPSSEVRRPTAAAIEAARDDLGLGGRPYIASVGTFEPRKNHRRLLAAFRRLSEGEPDLALVLIGGDGWGRQPRLGQGWTDRASVILTCYLEGATMNALIAGSEAFAYVSLYEGFGLPVIEGMGLGVPVVTSDRSSMPEVAGGAAVLVDPTDPVAIARGIGEARTDRARLVAAGLARSGSRDWADVAGATLDVYRWAAGRA
jgi:glycosyltransferase involved in cell wall biosynthesis